MVLTPILGACRLLLQQAGYLRRDRQLTSKSGVFNSTGGIAQSRRSGIRRRQNGGRLHLLHSSSHLVRPTKMIPSRNLPHSTASFLSVSFTPHMISNKDTVFFFKRHQKRARNFHGRLAVQSDGLPNRAKARAGRRSSSADLLAQIGTPL